MFKKIMFVISSLLVVMLAACGENDNISNDVNTHIYFAIDESFSEEGWRNFVLLEIDENDVIINLEFDGVNSSANSTRRSLTPENMVNINFEEEISIVEDLFIGDSVEELINALDDNLNVNDNIEIDMTSFVELTKTALESSPVESGPYIDGLYHVSSEESDDYGLVDFVNFIVKNGNIIAIHWNAISEDGTLRYDPFLISPTTEEAENQTWQQQANRVEQFLLEIQDPMEVTFDEYNMIEGVFGIDIEAATFISLVVSALAEGPITITPYE